ncbi:hypothetical protein niasHT_017234 [Heterodera trifolii]|uniref:Uncharacterized protein n=1 Tax=Heterodera trifolii TaxID=157864 RepID=A0ABD2L4I8_9BILA
MIRLNYNFHFLFTWLTFATFSVLAFDRDEPTNRHQPHHSLNAIGASAGGGGQGSMAGAGTATNPYMLPHGYANAGGAGPSSFVPLGQPPMQARQQSFDQTQFPQQFSVVQYQNFGQQPPPMQQTLAVPMANLSLEQTKSKKKSDRKPKKSTDQEAQTQIVQHHHAQNNQFAGQNSLFQQAFVQSMQQQIQPLSSQQYMFDQNQNAQFQQPLQQQMVQYQGQQPPLTQQTLADPMANLSFEQTKNKKKSDRKQKKVGPEAQHFQSVQQPLTNLQYPTVHQPRIVQDQFASQNALVQQTLAQSVQQQNQRIHQQNQFMGQQNIKNQ